MVTKMNPHILWYLPLLLLTLSLSACDTTPKTKALTLKEKGVEFHLARQWDSAEYYYLQAIPLAQEEKDLELLARLYNNMGLVAKAKNNYEARINYYEQSLTIYKELGKEELRAETLYNLGLTYKELQEIDKAIILINECIEILGKKDDSPTLGSAYTTLGNIYTQLGDREKAISSHEKAINYGNKSGSDRMGDYYNNIGKAWMSFGNDSIAEQWISKAISFKYNVGDSLSTATSFQNLSKIQLNKQDFNAAKESLLKARKLFIQKKDSINLTYNAVRILELPDTISGDHLNTTNWIDSVKSCLPYRAEYDLIATVLDAQKKVFLKEGDLSKAVELTDSARRIERNMLSTERIEKIAQFQAMHEFNMLNATILKQENALLQEASNRNIAIGISILIIVGMIFIWREKKRSDQLRAESDAARIRIETLLREMHHRIKNNLSAFAGIMGLEMRRLHDKSSRDLLRDSQNRLKAISKIHQKLYLSTEEALAKVDLNAYLAELCEEVMFNFNYSREDVKLQFDLDPVDLDTDRAILLGQLLNEALTNAFKYAFKNHPDPELSLSLKVIESQLIVSLRDNGPGMSLDDASPKGTGIGSTLFKELSKQLKAEWEIHEANGLEHRWILSVEKKKAA